MYHGPENLALTTGEKSTLFRIEPTTFELHCTLTGSPMGCPLCHRACCLGLLIRLVSGVHSGFSEISVSQETKRTVFSESWNVWFYKLCMCADIWPWSAPWHVEQTGFLSQKCLLKMDGKTTCVRNCPRWQTHTYTHTVFTVVAYVLIRVDSFLSLARRTEVI